MFYCWFIHSLIEGDLACFQFLTVTGSFAESVIKRLPIRSKFDTSIYEPDMVINDFLRADTRELSATPPTLSPRLFCILSLRRLRAENNLL